jgi:hypothetical protein
LWIGDENRHHRQFQPETCRRPSTKDGVWPPDTSTTERGDGPFERPWGMQ